MELDDLKALWREETRRLEQRLETKQALTARPARALGRFRWLLAFELGCAALAVGSCGASLDAWGSPRLLAAAVTLLVVMVGQLAGTVAQAVTLAAVDQGGPVLDTQRALERLTVLRVRVLWASAAGWLVAWVALAVLALGWLAGPAAVARLSSAWVVANVLGGAALAAVGLWASRRFAWSTRLREDLVGRSLAQARRQLAALAAFEAEDG